MIGVVYKFQPHNKLNGSLFYCFEYAAFLDANLYLVGISKTDLKLVVDVLSAKYSVPIDNLVPITITRLHALNLFKTLVLDIKSFYGCKEFLTNDIHVFSNEPHEMFRYKNNRTVTYYGSYEYQKYDVFNYLKLNFDIFKEVGTSGDGVFISGPDPKTKYDFPNKQIITKKHDRGCGNLFELVDSIHYVHSQLDTNNRIIPEAFHYGKTVTIEECCPKVKDSVALRYADILNNGLHNYTLTYEDRMIQACLRSNN